MTVDWRQELKHSWPLLVPSRTVEIASMPLNIPAPGGRIRIGVDAGGCRHLLVPIALGEDEPRPDDVDGSLLIRVVAHSFANRGARYVDIGCFRSDLNDLFDDVLVDILETISDGGSETTGVAAASVVDRWRNLLELRRQRLLTLVAQMSLFGELGTLELIAQGPSIDVDVWRGPLRERHDLVFPTCAVEVKAVGASSHAIEIHGVQQLEPPPGVPLVLVVVTVVESEEGDTLADLVDRLQARMSDGAAFGRRLAAVGYSSLDRDRFHHRFEIADTAHLFVGNDTPRIVPSSLVLGTPAPGVDYLVYMVSLNALEPLLSRDLHVLRTLVEGARP